MPWPRVLTPETLDHLAPDDPAAVRSRQDLLRVHRAMGTRGIVRSGWQALWPQGRPDRPVRVLELGAGDGRLLLAVARALAPRWPPVQLTLLDRQPVVRQSTLDGFAGLGWSTQVLVADVADVADWTGAPPPPRANGPAARWDLISTTLFLHHLDSGPLQRLLAAVAACSDRFLAVEPRRWAPALAGSHLVGLLGANAVTRGDAVRSVRAGFQGRELSAGWPPGHGWQLAEGQAGLFGHCFKAWRHGSGP